MIRMLIAVLVMGCSTLPANAQAKPTAARPNIIIIMADDMGFSDLGCYGSEIATPNIDRLAKKGLRFTQFYNNARCCPSRAALLTGLYSHQAGVGHGAVDRGFPGYLGRLNDRCVTIGEVLRSAGYRTFLSGKWHVGDKRPHWPVDRGFDRSYALVDGFSNYFRLEGNHKLALDDKLIQPEKNWYITDAISDNAVTFLKEHSKSDKPFFLYVPYTAPHWPLHALPEDIAKYKGKYVHGWDAVRKLRRKRLIDMGLVDAKWPLTPRDAKVPAWEDVKDKEAWDHKMAVYAAQIDRMDQGIGKILEQVRSLRVEDNTLVLFLSDNGGCHEVLNRGKPDALVGSADSFLSYGVGWANASNTPFRLYKSWAHEGGIATPLVAYWPAVIKKPGISHQQGHIIDLMATCVDIAGAEYPKEFQGRKITPLEGKSLLPIFQDKTRPGHEALYWEHQGNRAMRQGKWKLVARFKTPWELYDLDADRTEMQDLAKKHPEKVKELAAMYERWAERSGIVPFEKVRPRR